MKNRKSIVIQICAVVSGIFFISTLVMCGSVIELKEENKALEEQLKEVTYEVPELEPCIMCGEEVELQQYNTRYKIKCDISLDDNKGCLLETGTYDSKTELVEKWNSIPRGE